MRGEFTLLDLIRGSIFREPNKLLVNVLRNSCDLMRRQGIFSPISRVAPRITEQLNKILLNLLNVDIIIDLAAVGDVGNPVS